MCGNCIVLLSFISFLSASILLQLISIQFTMLFAHECQVNNVAKVSRITQFNNDEMFFATVTKYLIMGGLAFLFFR